MVDMAPQAAGVTSLEESLNSLSSEEITKFEKSFKDPKFMELLADYAKDIADPQSRAEQDQYLRQLEEGGRAQEVYGKGMQLVTPTPSFVAKTANSVSGQKIFINVCTSDKVAVATSKRQKKSDGSPKSGLMWDIPLMLGKCKEGSDRNRIQCMVFDFVVHPDTCRMAINNAAYKALILDSAVDNIEKVMGWKLTRQYSFPKLGFKVTPGVDKPSTVSVRHDTRSGQSSATSQDPSSGPTSSSTATSASGQQPAKPLVTELTNTTAAKASDQDKAGRSSGFRFPAAKAKPDKVPMRSLLTGTAVPSQPVAGRNIGTSSNDSEQSVMTAVATTRMEAVQLQPGASATAGGDDEGVVQPKFELVYRGQLDLGDAWEGPGITAAATKYPKELIIRVKLPGVKQAQQAQLNVEPQKLSLSVSGKYQLHIALPYAVAQTEGTASFNAAKQQLEVTLPVVPPRLPPAASDMGRNSQAQQQATANRTDDSRDPAASLLRKDADDAASSRDAATGLTSASEDAEASNEASSSAHQLRPGTTAGSDNGGQGMNVQGQSLTENQRRWLELHPGTSSSAPAVVVQHQAAPAAEPTDHDTLLAAAAAGHAFIASAAFGPQMPGYVFTTRDQGLGYYKDDNLGSASAKHTADRPKEDAVLPAGSALQQQSGRSVLHLLQPRLVSLAAAEELD